ncbi:retrovirus-related pol polyprotein from transposon TNT 1-94 [Tanacetum coccineum]
MGTVSELLLEEPRSGQQGPVTARVLKDLRLKKSKGIKLTFRATNIYFMEGSELTKGDRESQFMPYLKQHEVHANENRIMMERFGQPNNDPLALVSDASVQQYPTQSSKSPQSSTEPYPSDNFQLDSGSSSTENLIESLSNTLALLTQSYKSHLPQTNNQLRASSNARNKAMVQDGKVVGNVGAQNRGGMINPGQAKPIKCYNYNGLGHIARECPRPKRLQDSDYFKDKMLLMQAWRVEQCWMKNSPENDLALNVDHIFEADECDAFDSDVDEDHMDEYHEVHEMQNDVQHNYVVDSDADYTSDSNIIPYDQYVEDNEEHVVQCNASSVRNDALMSILDEMHEQGVQSRLTNKPDMVK